MVSAERSMGVVGGSISSVDVEDVAVVENGKGVAVVGAVVGAVVLVLLLLRSAEVDAVPPGRPEQQKERQRAYSSS